MRVVSCNAGHFRVPREVWWPGGRIGASLYEISHIELVTIELETDAGVRGVGFTYTVGHGGAAIHALLECEIVPHLLGRDARDVEAIWHELHAKLHFVGAGGVTAVAIAAADIALWDVRAAGAGLPLYRHLGVHRPSIPAYASAVNLALTTSELVEQMAAYRAEGFRAVKMKVGRSLRDDVERVGAVREAVGDGCELMVDANMAWDVAEAARRLDSLEPFELAWLEEPLPPHDVAAFAELQRSTAVPLAAGETLFTPDEFTPYLRSRAIRIPQPDVIRLGVTGWRRVAAAALEAGLRVAPHFVPEIHVHLACAIPNALNLEYLPIFELLLEEPIRIQEGEAIPPETPGHGMRFSDDVLAPFRVRAGEVQLR